MMPTRAEAEKILEEAGQCNFGPWVNHSRITAKCAEKIAELCEDLDSEKAYILGLLLSKLHCPASSNIFSASALVGKGCVKNGHRSCKMCLAEKYLPDCCPNDS
jgi:hypothetical protein